MSEKSYLKNQIKLVSIKANDTFTDEEYDKYMEIISLGNEIDRLEDNRLRLTPQGLWLSDGIASGAFLTNIVDVE